MNEVTLLDIKQIFGKNKLDIFNKITTETTITDFAILLGGIIGKIYETNVNYKNIKGDFLIKPNLKSIFNVIDADGKKWLDIHDRGNGIRPVMSLSKIRDYITNEIINEDGITEVEYGEYPQYAVSKELQEKLEGLYKNNELYETNKTYTTDSRKYDDVEENFLPQKHIEYKHNNKKYVRVKVNSYYNGSKFVLSNGEEYRDDDYVWVEVSRVKWLVDEENDIVLSKDLLISGIQFDNKDEYDGDFENANIYKYLNTYFIKDIQIKDSEMDLSKVTGTYEEAMALIEEAKRKTKAILNKSIVGRSYIKKL